MAIILARYKVPPRATVRTGKAEIRCLSVETLQDLELLIKQSRKKDKVLVVFDPPWSIDTSTTSLDQWLNFHRGLIGVRQSSAKQLELVCSAHHQPEVLSAEIGISLERDITDAYSNEFQRLLQVLYTNYLPQYIRVYESLELMAIAVDDSLEIAAHDFDSEEQVQEAIKELFDSHSQKEQNNRLSAQLSQAQKTLESQSAKSKELESRAQGLESSIKSQQTKIQTLEAEKQDLQSENNLLLAQLHQVQEELERYYLKNKAIESSVADATQMMRQIRIEFFRSISSRTAATNTATRRKR